MSLQPQDLIHGGLYRLKSKPEIFGRLDLSGLVITIMPSDGIMASFNADDWEGIPLTPEILTDWFPGKFRPVDGYWEADSLCGCLWNPRDLWFAINVDAGERVESQDVCALPFVHSLQRLYLALTGSPLEGQIGAKKRGRLRCC